MMGRVVNRDMAVVAAFLLFRRSKRVSVEGGRNMVLIEAMKAPVYVAAAERTSAAGIRLDELSPAGGCWNLYASRIAVSMVVPMAMNATTIWFQCFSVSHSLVECWNGV